MSPRVDDSLLVVDGGRMLQNRLIVGREFLGTKQVRVGGEIKVQTVLVGVLEKGLFVGIGESGLAQATSVEKRR